jgi:putative hydrolase of the HAD superfamily
MVRIRAILFDAGGTLIYPARPVGETYAKFAKKHGFKLAAETTTTAFRAAMKSGSPRKPGGVPNNGDDRVWWKEVVKNSLSGHAFAESPRFEEFFEEVYLYYAEPEAWGVYPEVVEVLETIRDFPVDLAVLSNWDARLHSVLDGHGLGEYFSRRFISAELGWEKPDAAIYRHVGESLRLPAGSLLSVGDDRANDVDAPKKAGWRAVHIDRPSSDLHAVMKVLGGAKKIADYR